MTEIESGRVHPTKVLCEEITRKEEFVAPGSLILKPINVKEPQIKARVLAVGTGTPSVPIGVSVGETVIFRPMSAQRLVLDEKDVLLLDTRDVLYIIP